MSDKSILAKLLATENISVQHTPGIKTAMFDLRNRVLMLPLWSGEVSNDLKDLLLGHETGHALDTPVEEYKQAYETIAKNIFGDDVTDRLIRTVAGFLNVIEDARIDKRQKRRYPGLRKNYLIGYKELIDRNFFGTAGRDINGMSFIDRANLYFKGGNIYLNIEFTPEEKVLIKKIDNLETFPDTVVLTEEVYRFCKDKLEEQELDEIELIDSDEEGEYDDYDDYDGANVNYREFDDDSDEDSEDDLIGGFRLVDGQTVWQDGPVILAMQRGAVLLIDEVDLGSNKLMCLQPVLEGKSVYLKKVGKVVHPEKGFNVIATANTKGKGSDDGRFIGTNVMNEAFLERFSITMEQEYPSAKVETKILNNVLGASGIEAKDFVEKLVKWADVIRQSFYEGALSEIISTRRLVHICEAYAIFNQNRVKAIELCLNRFDVDTKNAFLELYKKVDEDAVVETPVAEQADAEVPEML